MPGIEQTLTVGEGGAITCQVARPPGTRVRVIVLDESDVGLDGPLAPASLPEGTGFVHQVLADPAEAVWNDL